MVIKKPTKIIYGVKYLRYSPDFYENKRFNAQVYIRI